MRSSRSAAAYTRSCTGFRPRRTADVASTVEAGFLRCALTSSAVDISNMDISAERRETPAQSPESLPSITPAVFQIMVALAEGGLHGYGVMQDVERITNGAVRLGPGTLYRSIQRMLVDDVIEEIEIALGEETDADRRRYYRLTPKGLAIAKGEAQRLADLVDAARARGLLPSARAPRFR